jgi:mannose-1-phosphate guanylyltransferase
MLQHTLARSARVVRPSDTVTLIGRGHGRFLCDGTDNAIPGLVVEQPKDCGTAAGVLLAATHIRARDPLATVLILPSDHYIHPDERFAQHGRIACALAERYSDRFVLLGAVAKGAETDYGWILPGHHRPLRGDGEPERQAWPVTGFREKPGAEEAAELFRAGGLWSTLVVAVKLETLWQAARDRLPAMFVRFDFLYRLLRAASSDWIDLAQTSAELDDMYLDMPTADFSRDLLAHVARTSLVRPMEDVEWSDWGRPSRVMATVHRLQDTAPSGGFAPGTSVA